MDVTIARVVGASVVVILVWARYRHEVKVLFPTADRREILNSLRA